MLRIGEFSKLSRTTVKALRYYEKEGLLMPVATDAASGYRFYETRQLETAAQIKSYRQLGLSIGEIRRIFSGEDAAQILALRAEALQQLKQKADLQLSIIHFLLEEKVMKYQVTVKEIPEMIVYTAETVLAHYMDCMQWIPSVGEACKKLNPGIRCAEPPYEFLVYLDGEYRENNVRVRHYEAATAFGREDERIKFQTLPAAKVLSIYHRGAYENLGEAYAFLMAYAEKNGYQAAGLARESYIDGIWNKESAADWLTEIQLPIREKCGCTARE